jgi:hypothetical protein
LLLEVLIMEAVSEVNTDVGAFLGPRTVAVLELVKTSAASEHRDTHQLLGMG